MNAANAANEWAGFNLPQPIYNQQKAYAENSNLELWKQHEANLRLSQLESQARVAAASIASQSRAGQAPNASAHINSLKQLLTQRQQVALYLSAIKDPGQRRILEDNLNKIDAVIRHNATALGIPIEQAQTLVPSTQTTKINPP